MFALGQVMHTDGAFPNFSADRSLLKLSLQPRSGYDASLPQRYSPALNSAEPIFTPG